MADGLVVGGGLIGMLTARELAAAGMPVTLLERGVTGREASWAGGGILSPLYPWRYADAVTALATWSQSHYAALAAELLDETGIDPEWTPSGLLILDGEEQEVALSWAARCDSVMERIDAAGLARLEPRLGEVPASALWLPAVAHALKRTQGTTPGEELGGCGMK